MMKKSLKLMLAATVGLAGLGYGVNAQEQKPPLPPTEVIPPRPVVPPQPLEPGQPAVTPAPVLPSAEAAAAAELKPVALPAGATPKELNEQDDIRIAFLALIQGAGGTDVFDDVTKRLVDADRNRVVKFKDGKPDMKALNDRAQQIRATWKAKYGANFDPDRKLVFGQPGFLTIAQGEVSDPATIARNWPVAATIGGAAVPAAGRTPAATPREGSGAAPADVPNQRPQNAVQGPGQGDPNQPKTDAPRTPTPGDAPPAPNLRPQGAGPAPGQSDPARAAADARKAGGGDTNLDKGRNIAVVRYPASHGQPAVDASLIHELPDIWRFDVPDTVDGQRLHDNLLKHLNMLGDGTNWPADPNEAYRVVAHHVLEALYDVDVPVAGGGARVN